MCTNTHFGDLTFFNTSLYYFLNSLLKVLVQKYLKISNSHPAKNEKSTKSTAHVLNPCRKRHISSHMEYHEKQNTAIVFTHTPLNEFAKKKSLVLYFNPYSAVPNNG